MHNKKASKCWLAEVGVFCHELESSEIGKANEFYQKTSYSRLITEKERVFVIKNEIEIIGAVCIEAELDVQVLRGMYILPEHVNRKCGTRLLKFIEPILANSDSYCIPYAHLQGFYGIIGFDVTRLEEAPHFLVKRFNTYRSKGLDVLMMRRVRY